MPKDSTSGEVHRRPVIYAGRLIDQVVDAGLPGDCIVLGEQDPLPHKLTGVLDRATTLIVLDVPSFPFEAMTGNRWDIPMVVAPPFGSQREVFDH